jgi:hypothetical protein
MDLLDAPTCSADGTSISNRSRASCAETAHLPTIAVTVREAVETRLLRRHGARPESARWDDAARWRIRPHSEREARPEIGEMEAFG